VFGVFANCQRMHFHLLHSFVVDTDAKLQKLGSLELYDGSKMPLEAMTQVVVSGAFSLGHTLACLFPRSFFAISLVIFAYSPSSAFYRAWSWQVAIVVRGVMENAVA
jgi:hypothetical protein